VRSETAHKEDVGVRGPGPLLPDLISQGLSAHDRLKYYLLLLQTAGAYAQAPNRRPPTLRAEREASGVSDASLDAVVSASRMVADALVRIPRAAAIVEFVFGALRLMLEPIAATSAWQSDLRERADLYRLRLEQLIAQAPPCADDQLPPSAVAAMTRRSENAHDSAQQLAMDLLWELNRLQTAVGLESIAGAEAFGLTDADRALVRAFMTGVNETAVLGLDHHPSRTIATRDGDRLTIQHDLGMTDVQVVVAHVTSLETTVTYADRDRPRARFFRELLEPYAVAWEAETVADADRETSVGHYLAESDVDVERFLARVGSRLVFLIGWNRARRQLSRLVKGVDATAVLKWAAENNVGHSAFLQAGHIQLVYTALERAAPAQVRHGRRLDALLGRDAARKFLMALLRIVSVAVSSGRSAPLMDDEIEAELLQYLQRSDRMMFSAAADHALVIAAAVDWISRTVTRLKSKKPRTDNAATASLVRTWRSHADEIVRRTARLLDHSDELQHFRQLVTDGDRAVRALEQTAFTLTLVPVETSPAVLSLLDSLCGLVNGGVREYVQLLEEARDLSGGLVRSDLERFLVTVDRLVALEDHCDAAERAVLEHLIRASGDFRELHLVSAIAGHLDTAFDALVRSGLIVRDYVLGIAPRS